MSMATNIGTPIQDVNCDLRDTDTVLDDNAEMSIGTRVRATRKALGLTQKELAAKVGIRQPTLSELESGESQMTAHIGRLAAALGVSALWLETGRGPKVMVAAGKDPEALEQAIELLQLFHDSTAAGRDLILDTARVAQKRPDARYTTGTGTED